MAMMNTLLTGSTGFIGQALVHHLIQHTDYSLHLAVRNMGSQFMCDKIADQRVITHPVGDISSATNWHAALMGCNVVIHAAARVHVMDEQADDPLKAFRDVNVEGTLNLARQAVQAGVQRFIYLSSVKVNGESTQLHKPFGPDDVAMPEDPYAISKYEAEQGLLSLAANSPMDVVIIRPPLVYGPGVKGNFLRMMQLMQKGMPLPLGALKKNKRSFVSVGNLVSLIENCMTNPNAVNQVFLVSDDIDLSTTDLLQKIQTQLGNRVPLIPIPLWLLNGAATMLGKEAELNRLSSSLQVDISKSRDLLHWQPMEGVDEALYKTVQPLIESKAKIS